VVGRQALLWDRLLPNSTYTPGILLGLAMAAGPLLALLIYLIAARRWKLNVWQVLALSGSLLAFLVVGLVASVKIGGGSNLHNLDMFLISLIFAAGLALESILQSSADEPAKHFPAFHSLPRGWQTLVLAVIIIPTFQNVFGTFSVVLPPQERVVDALKDTRREVEMAKGKGDILFIDQRQLLTFGYISGIRLVPEYEKKYMMDLAMANDAGYFDQFYQDLASHRFSLIITEPLNANVQDDEYSFDDENNSWVRWVSIPILCYYEPVFIYEDVGLMALTPKTEKSLPYPEFECPAY